MAKATYNGTVIAQSDNTVMLEGNHYFPPESIDRQYFHDSTHESFCPAKGTASYYSIKVDGKTNADAAWYYATPKDSVQQIRNHVAFWKGVDVQS